MNTLLLSQLILFLRISLKSHDSLNPRCERRYKARHQFNLSASNDSCCLSSSTRGITFLHFHQSQHTNRLHAQPCGHTDCGEYSLNVFSWTSFPSVLIVSAVFRSSEPSVKLKCFFQSKTQLASISCLWVFDISNSCLQIPSFFFLPCLRFFSL